MYNYIVHIHFTDLKSGIKRKTTTTTNLVADENDEHDNKKKKVRTTFTGRQIFELEKMFENKKYLSSSERSEMAKLLNVTEQQVSTYVVGVDYINLCWF